MNTLEQYLTKSGLSEPDALTTLQAAGLVGDDVDSAAELNDDDCLKAVEYLMDLE